MEWTIFLKAMAFIGVLIFFAHRALARHNARLEAEERRNPLDLSSH
jgi:hypothetical protein